MAYPRLAFNTKRIIQPEVVIENYVVLEIMERPLEKRVVATIETNPGGVSHFVLWEGDAYDAIGQWTDTDAETAITQKMNELYAVEKIEVQR